MIDGWDSRYWDGTRAPAALGFKFFFGKVTEGGWPAGDSRYALLEHQRRACRAQGVPFGPYLYWRQSVDHIKQVDQFAAKVACSDAGKPELPAELDFEDPYAQPGCGAKVLALVREAIKIFPDRPLTYTRKSWWDKWVTPEQAAEIASVTDLWVAHYTTLPQPLLPRGWTDWTVWQYRGDIVVPGINSKVDFNRAKDEWYTRYA